MCGAIWCLALHGIFLAFNNLPIGAKRALAPYRDVLHTLERQYYGTKQCTAHHKQLAALHNYLPQHQKDGLKWQ